MSKKVAIVIGAGPAGLTAAYELIKRTDIKPIVIEQTESVGGLSRTIECLGNRIDIGGHRFFSKSDRVMDWWLGIMPIADGQEGEHEITYRQASRRVESKAQISDENVMLLRNRVSRIYALRQFFDYPIRMTMSNLSKLGLFRAINVVLSYLFRKVLPVKPEKNLEDFFINRFGDELYKTFFEDYTKKVWGRSCRELDASWGVQRIKGLNVTKEIFDAARALVGSAPADLNGNSLSERFLYPRLGPGQMWEEVAKLVLEGGGELVFNTRVNELTFSNGHIDSIVTTGDDGRKKIFKGEYFFSTMPIKTLIRSMKTAVPAHVKQVSEGLAYRDHVIVGVLVDNMKVGELNDAGVRLVSDTWIYIQEKDVRLGRLQVYNNWSPHMCCDDKKVWLGLEYFCNQDDDLWKLPDDEMIALAVEELVRIGLVEKTSVSDSAVFRIPKTYPSYTGSYSRFEEIVIFLDSIENLYPIGRNGMHKYNNQDHSMLTAMVSVDNLIEQRLDKSNIWSVNTEQEYIEEVK